MNHNTSPDALLAAVRHLPDGARRAAVAAVVPSMVDALDAAVAGRRGPLAKVPAGWLPVLLELVDEDTARRVAEADGRATAVRAVDGRRAAAPRGPRRANEVRYALWFHPARFAGVDAAGLDVAGRQAALGGFEDLPPLWRDHLAGTMHEIFDLHLAEGTGTVSSGLPASWWASRGELDRDVVMMLWDSYLPAHEVARVCAAAPLSAAAADWVAVDAGPAGATGQLVLVDRAHAAVGGPVRLGDVDGPEHLLEALDALEDPEVRAAAVAALLDGRAGPAEADQLGALVALGASPAQLAALAEVDEVVGVLDGFDDAQLAELLAAYGPQDTASLLGALPPGSALRGRVEALVPSALPAALPAVVGVGSDPDLTGLVLGHVADRLGDDPLAWAHLWSLAAGWPGTVDEALDCVAACTA